MSYPKASILIISYNQRSFIEEAIKGAIDQDYPNLEVVISDDGSTDGTAEIILKYQKMYPAIIVALLNNTNMGITMNSNAGLKKCTGKYIAFSYGDDVLLPGKISAQINWFEADSARVLCGHAVEVFSEKDSQTHIEPKKLLIGKGAELVILNGNIFPATSTMVRASSIPSHGFEPSLPIVSDFMMWIEVLASGGILGYVDGVYARYRRHDMNITKKRFHILLDVEKTLVIVKSRYPHLKKFCQYAMFKHVEYERALLSLEKGEYKAARSQFLVLFLKNPQYIECIFRVFQAFLIQIFHKFHRS